MDQVMETLDSLLKDKAPGIEIHGDSDRERTIPPKEEGGFEVRVIEDEMEYTVRMGACHFHFEKDADGVQELLSIVQYALSVHGRIKAYSKAGKEYKWTFEFKSKKDGNWYSYGTMGLLNLR
ncbi:hypothetical protein QLX67_13010, partial [Balneolaceae bacterium ANBcel3]|nr:hypothetical protein [Balneolaceae bacterium ANBcel3]